MSAKTTLFEEWARLNGVISPDRAVFDRLREELPTCTTHQQAVSLLREEGYRGRYPLLPGHVYDESVCYWRCLDCGTECRSDNPCDCCDEPWDGDAA